MHSGTVILLCWSLYLKDSKSKTELWDFKLADGRVWPWKALKGWLYELCVIQCVRVCLRMKWLFPERDMTVLTAATGLSIIRVLGWSIIRWQSSWHPVVTQGPTSYTTIRGQMIDVCLFHFTLRWLSRSNKLIFQDDGRWNPMCHWPWELRHTWHDRPTVLYVDFVWFSLSFWVAVSCRLR